MNTQYEVEIEGFSGPLDLLLHLVNQLKIDLYDIPVSEITKQYMTYIKQMQFLELNIASEYLVMAATLIELKSKMLLPKEKIEVEDDEYEEDPREQLQKRLLEYRQYKEIASKLQKKEGELMYTRPRIELENEEEIYIPEDSEVTVYDMLGALNKMMQRKRWKAPLPTKIERIDLTVNQRMEQIVQVLQKYKNGIFFDEMFIYKDKGHIVTTFIALLELMKKNKVKCKQDKHFAHIKIYKAN